MRENTVITVKRKHLNNTWLNITAAITSKKLQILMACLIDFGFPALRYENSF